MENGDNIFLLVLISMGGVCLLIAAFIITFIRHQNKIVKQQQHLHDVALAHQQELTRAVIKSQETERKRIGQDLHDDVGTALSSLRLTIEMMDQRSPEALLAFGQNCKKQIDRTIHNVRQISHNLSPQNIELYGFIGAIEDLCEMISQTGALQIQLSNLCGDRFNNFDNFTQISLYRVIEELLNNTIKHANATTINLDFTVAHLNNIIINYQDNGSHTFDLNVIKRGIGLHNIESRLGMIGASYHFIERAKQGFHLQITLNHYQ